MTIKEIKSKLREMEPAALSPVWALLGAVVLLIMGFYLYLEFGEKSFNPLTGAFFAYAAGLSGLAAGQLAARIRLSKLNRKLSEVGDRASDIGKTIRENLPGIPILAGLLLAAIPVFSYLAGFQVQEHALFISIWSFGFFAVSWYLLFLRIRLTILSWHAQRLAGTREEMPAVWRLGKNIERRLQRKIL